MPTFRIALANIQSPETPEESVALAEETIGRASSDGVDLLCFRECFVPGYRVAERSVPPPDQAFLERAWSTIGAAAERAHLGVVPGTERVAENGLLISVLVINPDGTRAGFQDKSQLDEDGTYAPGTGRHLFRRQARTVYRGYRHNATGLLAARYKSV
jgi:predicted amidohydrolase